MIAAVKSKDADGTFVKAMERKQRRPKFVPVKEMPASTSVVLKRKSKKGKSEAERKQRKKTKELATLIRKRTAASAHGFLDTPDGHGGPMMTILT